MRRLRHDCGTGIVAREAERVAQGVSELPAAGVPVARCLGQGRRQDAVDRLRKARPAGRQPRWGLRQVGVHHGRGLVAAERRRPGQQLEGRAGQRVLIGPAVYRLARDLLGGHVVQRPHDLSGPGHPGRGRHRFAQPEIRQVHVIGPPGQHVHQHVRRLHVTVQQPGAVCGVQRRGHRRDNRGHPARRQRSLPVQQRVGIPAGHVPHGDEEHPVRLARREHRDDVRIIDGRRRSRLTDEAPLKRRIARQRRRENLQRDQPAEPFITGPEHDRHPALADPFLEPVTRNARACREADDEAAGRSRIITTHHASPPLRTWRVGGYREAPIWNISRQAQANLQYLDLIVAVPRRDRKWPGKGPTVTPGPVRHKDFRPNGPYCAPWSSLSCAPGGQPAAP